MNAGFPTDEAGRPRILTVSQVTRAIKFVLEETFPEIWVAGEISNLSRPRSGHCYFSLKDADAQLPAVMWRSTAARVKFELQDGLAVVCRGRLNVYPPHGKYQLVVEQIQPEGLGALELAFRQLRDKLAKEGLFAPERKRPLPFYPRHVAVVTSPSGAAIHDFLQVVRRRRPDLNVTIFPVRVQGDEAAGEIVEAIRAANRWRERFDLIVVTRGGGSLEDLWSFNEEAVCRAVATSELPVVSAVGHEIDVTLCDLAADLRALTPTEAGERISPSRDDLLVRLREYEHRLKSTLTQQAASLRNRLEMLARHRVFRHPWEMLDVRRQTLDDWETRLNRAIAERVRRDGEHVARLAGKLESLSPLGVLERGYSITTTQDGRSVRDASELTPGDRIHTRVARGRLTSRVETVTPDE
ncbi:MAG: exodeoxyribonuclease VII large subunit [Planctomycetota bacterium]|nr:MAG: exodeoxyribonuclease VII large subunit [Planctomycetota bacterium]